MTKTNPPQEERQDSGNFFLGLVLGVAAGAMSAFFLGSKRGRKVLRGLRKEWERTQGELEAEGLARLNIESFTHTAKNVLRQIDQQAPKPHERLGAQQTLPKRKFFSR